MELLLMCIIICFLCINSYLVPISEYYRMLVDDIKKKEGYKKTFFGYKKIKKD